MDVLEVLFRENGEGGVPFDDLVLKVGQGSRPSRDTYIHATRQPLTYRQKTYSMNAPALSPSQRATCVAKPATAPHAHAFPCLSCAQLESGDVPFSREEVMAIIQELDEEGRLLYEDQASILYRA